MKTIYILFLLVGITANAQFEVKSVKEWEEVGRYASRIQLHKTKDNTSAKFIYLDAVELMDLSSGLFEFEFAIEENTLDNLYKVILDGLNEEKAHEVTLEFPEGKLYLIYSKPFRKWFVQLGFDSGEMVEDQNSIYKKRESFGLDKKLLKKLFNKN